MRKSQGKKTWKRVLSVCLVLAMLLGMLTITSKPVEVRAAAQNPTTEYLVGSKQVIRGIANTVEDLPQKQYENENGVNSWKALKVGTYERPFFILELVPYLEYAEFGYLVGGCEPIEYERANGQEMLYTSFANVMGTNEYAGKNNGEDLYFFEDEPEYNYSFYKNQNPWNASDYTVPSEALKGYYEVVANNKGKFVIEDVTTTDEESGEEKTVRKIVSNSSGNVIWHTMNKLERENSSETEFNMVLTEDNMKKVGDRIYTTRKCTSENPVVKIQSSKYQYYKNNELFIRDVVGLTGSAVDSFSVMYRPVTPAMLNACPQWADYADLIYINGIFHNGSAATLKEYWNDFNRLGVDWSLSDSHNFGDSKAYGKMVDITYNATMKILEKVTAPSDYAGLLIDNAVYEAFEGVTNSPVGSYKVSSSLTYKIYDYGLNPVSGLTVTETGKAQNLFKLILMSCSMNPNLAKNIYKDHLHVCKMKTNSDQLDLTTWDAEGGKNDPDFKICLDNKFQPWGNDKGTREGMFWWNGELQLVDGDAYLASGSRDIKNFIKSDSSYWTNFNYQYADVFKEVKSFVQGRVYTYNGNTSIAQVFRSGNVGAGEKFTDFYNFLHSDEGTRRIWETNNPGGEYDSVTQNTAPPSAALRYILGLGTFEDRITPYYDGEIKILDIEPSVDLNDLEPKWAGGAWALLFPNFAGTFTVDHYTMPAFVGKVDDLNSNYDLIYLGADVSGFRSNGTTVPDFRYDDTLDNKIYYHIGDLFKCLDYSDGDGVRYFNTVGDSDDAREPGNDITKVKIGGADMKVNTGNFYDYMKAGYPIVADSHLFMSDRMDPNSNMWSFISNYAYGSTSNPFGTANGVFRFSDSAEVERRVKENRINVSFVTWPREYDYGTYTDGVFNDAKYYLPTTGSGVNKTSYLKFSFKVDKPEDYSYKFYVDQDRNGKFDTSDIVMNKSVSSPTVTETYPLADTIIGVIQWRIEVYKTSNESCRAIKDGFSAAKNLKGSSEKKELKVLQIKPRGDKNPTVDMTSADYQKWYKDLDAFNITVDMMTWEQFNMYFKNIPGGQKFKFNMGASISDTNPGAELLAKAQTVEGKGLPAGFKSLDAYNMLIFGFADMYGNTDMSNLYGAVEYIYWFAMSGKGSVLFSHDTTSMYTYMFGDDNPSNSFEHRSYGTTSNIIMRDIMGMNRYGVNSSLLTDSHFRSGLATDLSSYRENRKAAGLLYDVTSKEENQGLTYAALLNMSKNSTFTLKNMVSIGDGGNQDKGHVTKVQNLNRGQISEYPYNIDPIIPVKTTHCQLFQLNMEDPELNVWYTLYPTTSGGGAKGLVAASPQDAANQYYIYSKGNIFYTGVGHEGPQTKEEMQLFVNTMVAAYRAGYKAPTVKVTNEEAIRLPWNHYSLPIPQEFNYSGDTNYLTQEGFGGDNVTIYFSPMDSNFSNDISVWIYYDADNITRDKRESEGGLSDADKKNISVLTVYDAAGTSYTATTCYSDEYGTGWYIPHLQHGHVYHFSYAKSDLSSKPNVIFECINDRSKERGYSYLNIYAEPLFFLD